MEKKGRKKGTGAKEANKSLVVFDYKKEFCSSLVRMMDQGFSFEAWCAHENIPPMVGKSWLLDHDDFAAAYELGMAKAQYWHEKNILDIANSQVPETENIRFRASSFMLKAKYSWSEKDLNVVDDLTDAQLYDKVIEMVHERGRWMPRKEKKLK